ncbi:SDR family oxidoreductase [Enterovibrio nigricans]|uniref:Nucleoside-diphosphate-sugar epimerase n=1 Tax=Enterovibrio nigricans DSM 22720 TaxID=1121868 RepID=A0A1T4U5E7_9GAMM|nr:SDR family oxidoreductase [Enterovibrio nigricans]PKF50556.1 NAD(P)-dependent oxidoreductase [Enterovibrio nigricans]SKA47748.1 Nucleoside-diphosphate-sugar epimerase [Enterovibrio nigricans DSM 22720]
MSKPIKTITVCGCGWLGMTLADQLVSDGYKVVGTKRSATDAKRLNQRGIQGVQFDLNDTESYQDKATVFGSDTLVLNIPPGRGKLESSEFVLAMKALIDEAKRGGVEQLIFISTTSVYGAAKGIIWENTPCAPDTASGIAHVEIEKYLSEQFAERGVVLRLSGLVGEARHPARYLAGRHDVPNGDDPVNLIHKVDCVNTIKALIAQNAKGGIYHLSAGEHPTRSSFYRWAAKEMGLEPPTFTKGEGAGKCIDASKTLQALSLTLSYASPFDMPLPALKKK